MKRAKPSTDVDLSSEEVDSSAVESDAEKRKNHSFVLTHLLLNPL